LPTVATGDSPQAVMNKVKQHAKINNVIFFILTSNLLKTIHAGIDN
jgi:hypothetical protein